MTDDKTGTPATVDEYLERLPADDRAALEDLRRKIRAAAPEAEETIAYQIPYYKERGSGLVSFGAAKKHCSLYVMSPDLVASLADELAPYEVAGATIRFKTDRPLPADLVRRLVHARIEENAAARSKKNKK